VLIYELVRTARRGRYVLLRWVYALTLLLVLGFVSARWSEPMAFHGGITPGDFAQMRAAQATRFAEAFFSIFICVQVFAVVLLTPAYAAGTIADERDRKTLEFLLATDLRNREIVLGKLMACIANTGMLVLTGLPILSLVQLLGGVDPNLVLAGYALTGLTVISLASVSILISVYSTKARDAIVLSYLALLAFLMFTFMVHTALEHARAAPRGFFLPIPFPVAPPKPEPWEFVLERLLTGNPVILVNELKNNWDRKIPLATVIPSLLGTYAVLHGTVALVAVTWAVRRLRLAALSSKRMKPLKKERTARHWARPSIGRTPMVWKEVYAEPGMAFNGFGKAIMAIIVIVSFAPPLWLAAVFVDEHWLGLASRPRAYQWQQLPRDINIWVRVVGTTVATLTLLGVAVRAAGGVTGERDRHTFDSLVSTQLEARDILYGKWVGAMLSVRWAWIWLGFVWGVGVWLGGLDVVTLPWLVLIWSVYAACFACLGQRFSITSSSTLRATLLTLGTFGLLCFGHWLPGWCVVSSNMPLSRSDPGGWFLDLQIFGLTPPMALGWFAFGGNEIGGANLVHRYGGPEPLAVLIAIVIGLCIWGQGAGWLWVTNQRLLAQRLGRKGHTLFLRWTDPWVERPLPAMSRPASPSSTTPGGQNDSQPKA
jgi:ABC-type transport system involved in multi-copper enzyme maturation permease subunit